jgi:HTH-type transcriptional regulator/antitoxin HigA
VPPRLVKTEADYEAALARVDELTSARPNTPEAKELALWVRLVEGYENRHYPIPLPDPVGTIRCRAATASARQDGTVAI